MSTMVNPSMLGFDLARRPGGARVATLLRGALATRPADLEILAAFAVPDSPARQEAWFAVARHEHEVSAPALLGDVREALEREDAVGARASVGALERAPLGTLDGLLRLVRTEVLDWTWRTEGDLSVQDPTAGLATTVICDAVAASYLEQALDERSRRVLCGPWVRATRLLDSRRDDLGPCGEAVERLLARLRLFTRAEWAALVDLHSRESAASWARAAHDATWATFLTDRLRPSLAAQMRLVELTADAPVEPAALATGVWNAVSGAVLGRVVDDVVRVTTARRLRAPLVDLLGG